MPEQTKIHRETHRSEDWVVLRRELKRGSRERRRGLSGVAPRERSSSSRAAGAPLDESSVESSELHGLREGSPQVLPLEPMAMLRRGHWGIGLRCCGSPLIAQRGGERWILMGFWIFSSGDSASFFYFIFTLSRHRKKRKGKATVRLFSHLFCISRKKK